MIARGRALPCRCISRRDLYSRPVLACVAGHHGLHHTPWCCLARKDAAMSVHLHAPHELRHDADRLAYAREIVRAEAAALEQVAHRLDQAFLKVVDLFFNCAGRICITGTGKSADVGQKIAGTLNSTGTRAYVLDSTRAVHGDLGMIHHLDVVLALSHSGESEEIVRLLPSLKQMAGALVAMTSNAQSTL